MKLELDTAFENIEAEKIRLKNEGLNKPLHELPKYNPAEKRKPRYASNTTDPALSNHQN